jgi:hypothetical protein
MSLTKFQKDYVNVSLAMAGGITICEFIYNGYYSKEIREYKKNPIYGNGLYFLPGINIMTSFTIIPYKFGQFISFIYKN